MRAKLPDSRTHFHLQILKKHDKMLPHSPCRQFYISHLHNQPWVQARTGGGVLGLAHAHNSPAAGATGQTTTSLTRDLHPSACPPPQGNYADLLLILSSVYATLRGDEVAAGPAVPADDTGFVHRWSGRGCPAVGKLPSAA